MYMMTSRYGEELAMDLDDMLRRAAPRTSSVSAEVMEALAELVDVAEEEAIRSAKPARVSRRAAWAGAVVAASVVGLGGVAAAAGILPTKAWHWSSGSGATCDLQVSAGLRRSLSGTSEKASYSRAEQITTLREARTYLSALDLSKIDTKAAEGRWLAYVQRVSSAKTSEAELRRKFAGDDLEVHALLFEVKTMLSQELAEHGESIDAITITLANRCAQ